MKEMADEIGDSEVSEASRDDARSIGSILAAGGHAPVSSHTDYWNHVLGK